MKSLKYILFTIIVSIVFINSASATSCVYKTKTGTKYFSSTVTITCNASTNVFCTISDGEYTLNNGVVKLTASNFKDGKYSTCPKYIYADVNTTDKKIDKLSLKRSSVAAVFLLDKEASTFGEYDKTGISSYTEDPRYIEAQRTYKSACKKVNGSIVDRIKCDDARETMKSVKKEYEVQEAENAYEKDVRYITAVENANKYCNSSDIVNYDSSKCEEAQKRVKEIKEFYEQPDEQTSDYDPKAFCNRNEVKGTFRAFGWIIRILKILMPVLLILFASIDLFKAIISSKADEITKSVKTLTVRAILAVVVFFVPTILSFALKLFGGDEIYNEIGGSFGNCTYCMLNPNDAACDTMWGGTR